MDKSLAIITGLFFSNILNFFDILSGNEASEYYGEIHNSVINKILHIMFIPIASYYFLLWIPEMFNMNKRKAQSFMTFIYYTLCTHYCTIDLTIGLLTFSSYYGFYSKAMHDYGSYKKYHTLIYYFVIMSSIEFIGHTLFEHEQSRFSGILNAVLYSHYFDTKILFNYFL